MAESYTSPVIPDGPALDAAFQKANTAVQPADLGTAAATDASDYATAAQGSKADTALQPADVDDAPVDGATAAPISSNWAANKALVSDPTGITGADRITNVVSLTQAEYDALTPDAATLYVVIG